MSDGKIYIVITKQAPGVPTPGIPNITTPKEENKSSSSLSYFAHRFYSFVESEAKQAIQYGVSNIGNFTGNYQMQREVQSAIALSHKVVNLGMAAIQGATSAAAIGASATAGGIIGITIAAAAVAIDYSMQYYSNLVQERKNNFNIEKLRERSGLNPLLDGNRGTFE